VRNSSDPGAFANRDGGGAFGAKNLVDGFQKDLPKLSMMVRPLFYGPLFWGHNQTYIFILTLSR
jgi:hypothetical protein